MTSKKQPRRLTPEELALHEMAQVYTQLATQLDLAFGDDNEELDEDDITPEQQHIIDDIHALEEEWMTDPIQRAELSVIQFTED